jgi:hypothetical protein
VKKKLGEISEEFFFKNDIASLGEIQIYSILIFYEIKKPGKIVKRRTKFEEIDEGFFSKTTLFHWLKFKFVKWVPLVRGTKTHG